MNTNKQGEHMITPRRTIALDIETGPLPVQAREFLRPTRDSIKLGNAKDPVKVEAIIAEAMADFEAGTKAALDAMSGEVLLVGIMDVATGEVIQLHGNEPETIAHAFEYLIHAHLVVGHNIAAFDLPFLIRRAWFHDMRVPSRAIELVEHFRHGDLFDTMREWGCGDRQERVSLSKLCGFFGVPSPKTGEVTGATFGQHWHAGNRAACLDYNAQDLRAETEVAIRMGMEIQ